MVADEIRKLAESAGRRAEEIAKLIHEIQSDTGEVADEMRLSSSVISEGREDIDMIAASLEQHSLEHGEATRRCAPRASSAAPMRTRSKSSAWSAIDGRDLRSGRRARPLRSIASSKRRVCSRSRPPRWWNPRIRSDRDSLRSSRRCSPTSRPFPRTRRPRPGIDECTPAENLRAEDRLLTFEVAGDFYAMPIAGVLEVAEMGRLTCIPTLPTRIGGGVINHHGDALPVINCASLFDVNEAALGEPEHHPRDRRPGTGEAAQLGIPVDRVLGSGRWCRGSRGMPGAKAVAERRSIQGRVCERAGSGATRESGEKRDREFIGSKGLNPKGEGDGENSGRRRRIVHASDDPRDRRV